MAQYAEKIARNWIGGLEVSNPRLWSGTFTEDSGYIGGVNTKDPDAPRALFSYGSHYPVAIVEETGKRVWVNETPYYVNETDKCNSAYYQYGEALYRSAYTYRPRRKKTPSPTTKGHCKAVEDALRMAGYVRADATHENKTVYTEDTEGEPLTHTMRLWIKA